MEADAVIAATGLRPDHAIAAELRLALEPGLRARPPWAPSSTGRCRAVLPSPVSSRQPAPGFLPDQCADERFTDAYGEDEC